MNAYTPLKKAFVALLLCLTCHTQLAHSQNQLFSIVSHQWTPYASQELRYFGIVPRIVTNALNRQSINTRYHFMTGERALDNILNEKFDGAIDWLSQDMKYDALLISDPIIQIKSALFYLPNTPTPHSEKDLISSTMGFNPHYVYNFPTYHLFQKQYIATVSSESDLINFIRLINLEIDYFLSPLLSSRIL